MVIRTLTIAAIAASFSATPMLACAASPQKAFNSCVKAFVADMSNDGAVRLKLRASRYVDQGLEIGDPSSISGDSELRLVARDAHDRHLVALAYCTVNAQGDVVELSDSF